MPSTAMKIFLKAFLIIIVLTAVMSGIMAFIVMYTKAWGSDMQALFEVYLFPAILLLMCGVSLITFMRLMAEDKKKH